MDLPVKQTKKDTFAFTRQFETFRAHRLVVSLAHCQLITRCAAWYSILWDRVLIPLQVLILAKMELKCLNLCARYDLWLVGLKRCNFDRIRTTLNTFSSLWWRKHFRAYKFHWSRFSCSGVEIASNPLINIHYQPCSCSQLVFELCFHSLLTDTSDQNKSRL